MAKLMATALTLTTLTGVAACGGGGGEGGEVKLSFYTWGNETEMEITRGLVDSFNAENEGKIEVAITPVASGDYETKVTNAMRGRTVPDVIIAGDGEIKNWIDQGGIAPLDDYAAASEEINLDEMYQDGVNRYRYDIASRKGGTGKLYGIMRDYSPSCLYYNKDAMAAVDIECISVSAEQSQTQYGTQKAYFEHEGQWYFNNQIALDWNELLTLSQKLTSNTEAPVRNNSSITKYGMYVINWFGFGFSVGGDCLEWVEDSSLSTGGKYEFTLFDETKNYIVKEGQTVVVNDKTYNAGEIVAYTDKDELTATQKAQCTELPSQMEAMQYFVDLSVTHKVSPKPAVSASSSTYGLFSSKQCAMIIETRYATGIYRKTIDEAQDAFDWDVAPLPKHANGIAAGHSGSEALCIPAKSKHKDEAWKFIEYMTGEEGSKRFAEAGFTVPNTRELANSETFLQSNKNPKNSKIFVEAAEYQTTGDWGYLPSKAWINVWATDLNSKVLGGTQTLVWLRDTYSAATQKVIDDYYKNVQ